MWTTKGLTRGSKPPGIVLLLLYPVVCRAFSEDAQAAPSEDSDPFGPTGESGASFPVPSFWDKPFGVGNDDAAWRNVAHPQPFITFCLFYAGNVQHGRLKHEHDLRRTMEDMKITATYIRKHHPDKEKYPIVFVTDVSTRVPEFAMELSRTASHESPTILTFFNTRQVQ
eukprot:1372113-Pyramimonas_sp.AAC.1